eukprot:CAMPEP_0197539240 /NCGR_PEP_ID=MMETSP1318-20131121/62099_1 /TAXON_ID=552666 /ORGANISM="Partenskyella glossopodia, Strain RCC365" /LENGTH=410 /DNA_ID=CAMNT_0043097905 /DNA_START=405 /DNA_END=1637 /DNA_ORIENTATION=-
MLLETEEVANKLDVFGVDPNETSVKPGTVSASMLQIRYNLGSDELLRYGVRDLTDFSSFRLGKFFESVDALTGDVVYRHSKFFDPDFEDKYYWVTGGHYFSRKLAKTDIYKDVYLRVYITNVGTKSIEVRTDAIQPSADHPDGEILVNFCHTTMVALDKKTHKTANAYPLVEDPNDELEKARKVLAQKHKLELIQRRENSMMLKDKMSSPPTKREMESVHELHRKLTEMRRNPQVKEVEMVREHTHICSRRIFPQYRNVHGKLFGGFVMIESYDLACFAAKYFMGIEPVAVGLDEAVFNMPISIGDMVLFTARVVHSSRKAIRVNVSVELLHPKAIGPDRIKERIYGSDGRVIGKKTNRLVFIFIAEPGKQLLREVAPNTYEEVLMHVDALRRYEEEGPTDKFMEERYQF